MFYSSTIYCRGKQRYEIEVFVCEWVCGGWLYATLCPQSLVALRLSPAALPVSGSCCLRVGFCALCCRYGLVGSCCFARRAVYIVLTRMACMCYQVDSLSLFVWVNAAVYFFVCVEGRRGVKEPCVVFAGRFSGRSCLLHGKSKVETCRRDSVYAQWLGVQWTGVVCQAIRRAIMCEVKWKHKIMGMSGYNRTPRVAVMWLSLLGNAYSLRHTRTGNRHG